MGVQNSTLTVKGKVGNVVGYKGRNGKKLMRIRQTEVYNPKTDGQLFQRMIIATAARAYSLLNSVCDHSFQGIAVGGQSQSYFLKRASKDIREYISKNYPDANVTSLLKFVGLSSPTNINLTGAGLLISEGTLKEIPVTINGEDVEFGSNMDFENEMTLSQLMASINAEPGDQISVITIGSAYGCAKSRYVISPNLTTQQLSMKWSAAKADSNVIVEKEESDNAPLGFNPDSGYVMIPQGNTDSYAVALVLSRKNGSSWMRSTQRLIFTGDVAAALETNAPSKVLADWKAGTAQIAGENPYFLNQAEQG